MNDAIEALLREGEPVAPAIGAVVMRGGVELYTSNPDHVFDLASLTKPLCTAELAMRAVVAGVLDLDRGHALLPEGVTIRHLLQHAAGYPAWRALWDEGDRAAIIRAAIRTPLVNAPGTVHTYSDLGFIALGAVLEAEGGARLDALWKGSLRWGDATAEPTFCEERKVELRGEVHDRNCAAMDGVGPHAGLFGSARETATAAARWLVEVPLAARAFTERGPGGHVLGWDSPFPEGQSSSGARPPAGLVGHLGFTGTAVWMRPSDGLIAVLLTNRVMRRGGTQEIRNLRRTWFQAVWDRFA